MKVANRPRKRAKSKPQGQQSVQARLSAAEWVCLGLVAVVTVVSVLKAPVLPVNDPALYEYYGRRLVEGAHLYTDLPEVKLPSLYYVNALYQLVFGSNYALHTCVEAALNVSAALLFALILRQNRIRGWPQATLLFAAVYSLGIDQFDYPEYYAVPLILLAYWLAFRRLELAAGVAVAFATTFWVQSPIMLVPLLARKVPWGQKRGVLIGLVLTFVAFVLAVVPILGTHWLLRPLATWPGFLQGSLSGLMQSSEVMGKLGETLFHAGIGALVVLLLMVIRRFETEAQRFSLWWLGCAFIGAMIPPSLFPWYFLPVMPAAVMAVATYGLTWKSAVQRPVFAIAVCALVSYAVWIDYQDATYLKGYAAYVVTVGDWIRSTVGPGRVLWTVNYIPEVYLASDAVEPYAGASNTSHIVYTRSMQTVGPGLQVGAWTRVPDLVAEGGPFAPPRPRSKFVLWDPTTRISKEYVPVCGGTAGGHIRLYASAQLCPILSAPYPSCHC